MRLRLGLYPQRAAAASSSQYLLEYEEAWGRGLVGCGATLRIGGGRTSNVVQKEGGHGVCGTTNSRQRPTYWYACSPLGGKLCARRIGVSDGTKLLAIRIVF